MMIVATPLGGGHYLVDCLAGITVAISSIVATGWISRICSRTATRSPQLAARGTTATPDAVVRIPRPI